MNIALFERKIDKNILKQLLNVVESMGLFLKNSDIIFCFFLEGKVEPILLDNYKIITLKCTSLKNISEFLLIKKIRLIYFISSNHFVDLFLIHYFKEQGVISIFFQHGVVIEFNENKKYKIFPTNKLVFFLKGIKKYLLFTLFVLYNIKFIKNKTKIIFILLKKIKLIINKYPLGLYQQINFKEAICDYALVFANRDKEYFSFNHGYELNKIFCRGYIQNIIYNNISLFDHKDYYVYVSSGLLDANIIKLNFEAEITYLIKLIEAVNSINKKLIIKLHPLDDINKYLNSSLKYYEGDYEIYQHGDVKEMIDNAEVVIGELSTALYYAVNSYKPIIIILRQDIKEYSFDYTKYGIGVKVEIENLKKFLIENKKLNINVDNYNIFINYFIKEPLSNNLNTFQSLLLEILNKN